MKRYFLRCTTVKILWISSITNLCWPSQFILQKQFLSFHAQPNALKKAYTKLLIADNTNIVSICSPHIKCGLIVQFIQLTSKKCNSFALFILRSKHCFILENHMFWFMMEANHKTIRLIIRFVQWRNL